MTDPIPSRKALLNAFEGGGLIRPLAVVLADIAVFGGGLALVLLGSLGWKILGSVLATGGIVRLFLVGHEACHGSFFRSSKLNNIVGRIAFLPSATAYSLWDVGHNVAHHGFNNLKGRDQVWAPFSKEEFDRLPAHRRVLERIYRSGLGWGLYYFWEMWWKKLYFATKAEIGSSRLKYKLDSVLVTVGLAAWIGGIVAVSVVTEQSLWLLGTLGFLIPFALWNVIMGFVVFLHHTHPKIAWFAKRHEWQRCRAYLTATVQVRLPLGLDRLMHNIMEHNAHHVNPRIPMFTLRRAQQALRDRFTTEVHAYRLGWKSYMDCVRRCKLYDYANHAWLDFRGQVTSRVQLIIPGGQDGNAAAAAA